MANLCKITKIGAGLILLMGLVACGSYEAELSYIQSEVLITGDVEMSIVLGNDESYTTYKVEDEGEKYKAIALEEVVEKAKPISEDYSILLIGEDGLASEIDGENLEGCHLTFSNEMGWELLTAYHPISSRVKLIDEIIVIANDQRKYGIGFSGKTKSTYYTAGALYRRGYETKLQKEGRSELNDRWVKVYTTKKSVPLADLMDYDKTVAVLTKEGRVIYDRPNNESYIYLNDNQVNYMTTEEELIKDIGGILGDPPKFSITEVYKDAIALLEKNQRIMIVEVDGLGMEMMKEARRQGYIKELEGIAYQEALATYPAVSTVGLAAMITGETGDVNGIYSRETKALKVDDLFKKAEEMDKSYAYIEGSMNLIETSIKPKLSLDKETLDDGVFRNTQQAILESNDLIFTHFHSVDDVATAYGPYEQQTMEQMQQVAKMVKDLVHQFEGMVIVTADHGVHETEEGGTHGCVCREDMIVPYIVMEGGK